MNAINIRSWADFRAFLSVALPVVTTFLVTLGVVKQEQAALWIGLGTALLGPAVHFFMARSVSSFRMAFYAVLGAAQLLLIGYGLIDQASIGLWMPVISLIVGGSAGGVASANTDTTAASGA